MGHARTKPTLAEALVLESNDALLAVSVQGVVLLWNDAATALFGFGPQDIVGRSIEETLVPADAIPEVRRELAALLEGGGALRKDRVLRRRDGTPVRANVSMRVASNNDGSEDAVLIRIAECSSGQPRASAPESIFRDLLEAAPDAIIVIGTDGLMTFVNRQTEVFFGYARTDLLGKPIDMVIPEHARAAHASHPPTAFEDLRGRPPGGTELWVRLRDGSELPVEITFSPVRVGAESLVIAAIRDTTERRKAEAKFRGLLESAPDAMIIAEKSGVIVLVNAQTEKLFGYAREELLGQSIELLVPKRFHTTHPARRDDYFAAPKARPMGAEIDLWAVRKDGTEFPAEISLSPIETADGVLVTAAIRDITEQRRRRLEELRRNRLELEQDNRRMQEANRLKSEFLANMSHELRTPLNAIIGFTELMYKGKVGPVSENHREYLGDILNSSRHLLQLINDVLDLAKVESGRIELRPETTELLPLVTEVRDILRGFASTKGIHVSIDVDPTVSTVVVDSGKLKQVLYNYLSNALKFTPDGGRVAVRVVAESEGYFRAEVEDTGIGIKHEDLARLFVEFQQLDSGMTKKYAGTGLGLALTKRMVETQGGRVGVRSTLGAGSVFWAVLPRSPAHGFVPPPPPARLPSGSMRAITTAAASKLLIIDDDPSAGRLMQAAFEPLGVDVICAPTPSDALRAIEKGIPTVVVLDVLMPQMSGYDLLECLRIMPQMREVPIILWTVKELSEARRNRVHSLAQGVVLKGQGGVDPIVAAVRSYLSPGSEGSDGR